MDIFLQKDAHNLLNNKKVVFIGDSNIRALYKDFLCLLLQSKFISAKILKTKNEKSCFGDKRLTDGPKTNGRNYKEERKGEINNTNLSFYFITRVYDSYVRGILKYLSRESEIPDVMIINSCLWDVTRWGPDGVKSFKDDLKTLMKDLKTLMPNCLVIWVTAPPIAGELKGGFLVKELEFLKYSLRFHVMEANQYARRIVVDNGFDVVDSHYHLKLQLHRRETDGIHWLPEAVRYVTNLLLTHISLAWNVPLPHRYKPKNEASDLIPDEKSTATTLETKSTKKISSVVVAKSTNASCESTEKRWEKENSDIILHSQRNNKSSKERKHNVKESHHAYLSKVQRQERHKRIKKWQSSSNVNSPPRNNFVNLRVNCSNNYNQNDSGYFPSPSQLQCSPEPFLPSKTQMHISSPRSSPLLPHPYDRYSSRALVAPKPMYNNHTSIPRYLPHHHKRHASMYATNFSFSNDPYLANPVPERDTRQVICSVPSNQIPYVFSNITQQPIIDFTSLNTIPFGFQF